MEDAVSQGVCTIAECRRAHAGGSSIEPTILTGVTDDMKVFREQIFGSVVPLFKTRTEEGLIAMAPFGGG